MTEIASDNPEIKKLLGKLWLKHTYDKLGALITLGIVWPFFPIVALLIKTDGLLHPENAGPVFYVEPRISAGKTFQIIKFRTVKKETIEWIRQKPDARSITASDGKTWAGKIILNWYLDEFPQLINIAKGEMSFVGLRPHIVEHTQEEVRGGFCYRQVLRAGLFGVPQACKKDPQYQAILERMARTHKPEESLLNTLDGLYIRECKERSPLGILFLDIYLAYRCAIVILRGGG